jgi:hypothetical protein
MTRKDYVLIAQALKIGHFTTESHGATLEYNVLRNEGIDAAARFIATALAADNSRFDRARFLAAAGVPNDA